MSLIKNNFIKFNLSFWKKLSTQSKFNDKILIEPMDSIMHYSIVYIHNTAFNAKIISEAQSYSIYWLKSSEEKYEDIVKSYNNIQFIEPEELNLIEKIHFKIIYRIKLLKILFTQKVLDLKYDGILWGDIIYDTVLYKFKLLSIKISDSRLKDTLYRVLYHYFLYKKTLKKNNFKAVLVCERLAIQSCVLQRASLKLGLKTYDLNGSFGNSLSGNIRCIYRLADMKEGVYKPTQDIFNHLLKIDNSIMENEFNSYFKGRFDGLHGDSYYAYESEKIYKNRFDFCNDFRLSPHNKNIFVMLHSFNDYPQTSSKWLLFDDYFDWFLNILDFAIKDSSVNWIFKEHPVRKYFENNKDDFEQVIKNFENKGNIRIIRYNDSFNNLSIINVADVILTCIGTAGIEMPAVGGIPSVVAAESDYTGFGVVYENSNKKDYFRMLKNLKNIPKLSPEMQYKAKIIFLYARKYSRVTPQWQPPYSKPSDEHEWYINEDLFLTKVMEHFECNKPKIINQFYSMVEEVKKNDFYRILNLPK